VVSLGANALAADFFFAFAFAIGFCFGFAVADGLAVGVPESGFVV